VHPDKNMGNTRACESFKKLQCAYEASWFILYFLFDLQKIKDKGAKKVVEQHIH
jgi:hypothetical protein